MSTRRLTIDMHDDLSRSYGDTGLGSLPAGCLVLAPGIDSAAPLLDSYGAEPSVPATEGSVDAVGVAAAEGGYVCFESLGGFQGTRPEVLAAVARNCHPPLSAGVRWDIDGGVYVAILADRIHSEIDLTDWDGDVAGLPASVPTSVRAWAQEAFDADGDLVGFGIALAAAVTGVHVNVADLGAAAAFRIDPVPSSATADELESTPLWREDQELAERVGRLSAQRQRDLAEWVCLRLLELADLAADEKLAEVTSQFSTSGWPVMTSGARRRLGQLARERDRQELREGNRRSVSSLLRRHYMAYWAGYSLEFTCHPHAATAAWRALYATRPVLANADLVNSNTFASDQFGQALQAQLA